MIKFSPEYTAELLQEHHDELVGFLVRRVSCRDAAADILQDVFIRLIQIEAEICIQNPRAFLYRVAANLAIDHLRKRQREEARRADDEQLFDWPDASPGLERRVFSEQQLACLKTAIAELPPRCREVFILHKFKQYPYSKIMRDLGIAESTVLKHVVKAMDHCRRRLKELDDDPEF